MAQDLPYPRKQQLAVGLLRGMGLLHLVKGAWVAALIAPEIPSVAWVIAGAHIGIAAIAWGLSRAATRSPMLAMAGLALLLIGLQFNALPRHSSMDLSTSGTLLMAILQILPNLIGMLALALLLGNPDGKFAHISAKARWLSKPLQWILVTGTTLLFTELGLRQIGFEPGVVQRNPYLTRVESLQPLHAYWTDVHGIYSVSPAGRRCLTQYIAARNTPNAPQEWPQHLMGELGWVWEEHRAILKGELQTPFSRHLDSLRQLPPTQLDAIDQANLDLLENPINADGFRSIPFRNDSTSKTKVLLLGDSFTWGHSASHLGNSFGDLLITKGFAVYNSGISATDPSQYEAVAERFIPIIHPDLVVVNLYMGNDIFYFDRPVSPFQSPAYCTNAGALIANPGPEWLPTPEKVYGFVRAEGRIPDVRRGSFNDFCSGSCLGTLAWKALSGLGLIPFVRTNKEYWERCEPLMHKQSVTGSHLHRIQKLCEAQGARFVLAVIPQFPEDAKSILSKYPEVFEGIGPEMVQGLVAEDYSAPGGHFNDSGHRKWAEMLESLLSSSR